MLVRCLLGSLPPAGSSLFLFGPRGTGKSTWLAEHFGSSPLQINLLKSSEFLAYKRNPSLLGEQVAALPKGAWVTIDEVQKLPALLEEVHALLFDRGNDISEVGLLTSCLRDEWTNSQH